MLVLYENNNIKLRELPLKSNLHYKSCCKVLNSLVQANLVNLKTLKSDQRNVRLKMTLKGFKLTKKLIEANEVLLGAPNKKCKAHGMLMLSFDDL